MTRLQFTGLGVRQALMARNRHLARIMRERLRSTAWDAATIARRAGVSRGIMARILCGDDEVEFGTICDVAHELQLSVELRLHVDLGWKPGEILSVVDVALLRLRGRR